jgi:hypothetical protein
MRKAALVRPAAMLSIMDGGLVMLRVGLVGLFMGCAAPALAVEDEGTAGSSEWPEADKQIALDACRTLTRKAGLCECLVDGLQAQFPSLNALVRNREKSKDQAAGLAGKRCEERFGK